MITVENRVIKSSGVEELLEVTIDSNFNFYRACLVFMQEGKS